MIYLIFKGIMCFFFERCDTHVRVDDIIHVTGDFDVTTNTCTVSDNSHNFIVVNPDLLISGTSVVSGLHCMRR